MILSPFKLFTLGDVRPPFFVLRRFKKMLLFSYASGNQPSHPESSYIKLPNGGLQCKSIWTFFFIHITETKITFS